jgi:CubicO group peptidase (beta-lactamase class C family)
MSCKQLTSIIKMIKISKLLSFAFSLFLSNYALSQTNEEADRKIDSLFASYNSKTPGVAVAIVKDGKVIFKKGYGMANLNNNIPITAQTVFNIASVSKQFTAFTIYLLENEGRLSFEDNVRKYIPELPVYETPIKIKHLLGHTSGLRDHVALASIAGGYIGGDINTTEQNLKLLSRVKGLNFVPGSTFGYCNSNYTILAEIVHRITGKTFSDYTNEKIFTPLGMTSTQFSDNYQTVVKNKAESYELENNRYYHKPVIESNPGPSNLLTTIEDLSKWVLNFENPIVGNNKIIKAFNEPSYLDNGKKVVLRILDGDTIFVAKGQYVSKDKGNYIGYGGHTAGFRTFLGRYPDHHLAIIQLSNDEDHERLGGRWDIFDFYIKDQLVEKKQANVTVSSNNPAISPTPNNAVDLNEFVGKYYNDELEARYNFEVKNNKLIMKHLRLYDVDLKLIGENKFSGSGPYTFAFEINFIRNETGKVIGFDISNFGGKNLKFLKEK